tara:strand:- start:2828 stop:3049 length:222 start_codon:yes stop_codon:yes gene_type:complete
MIKAYFEDIMDFSLLSISFIFTLFITNLNQMLEIHITTEILSDLITLITQITIFGVVLYKLKLLRKKQKNGDS